MPTSDAKKRAIAEPSTAGPSKILLFQKKATSSSSSPTSSVKSTISFTSTSADEEVMNAKKKLFMESRKNTTIHLIENHSRFYLGLEKSTYVLVNMIIERENIIYKDVLIVLKKIRLDDVYFRLAMDFGTSTSTIQRIFVSGVPKIVKVLMNFVFLPTKEQIKQLLPIPFRYRYSNVQHIIDCFEIEIQKPSNPLYQSHTWSEYKQCNTIKYLISGTPNGFITFISGGFGGRITDCNIIKASNFLDHVNNCDVMADRGFKHVASMLMEKNSRLIRPPSVNTSTPLTKEEAKEAKRIAALRIHIERLIRRIREYKILDIHSCVHNNLVYLLDQIVIIVCALCNLQSPLIK